jgi:hypothetical protein
MKEVFTHSKTEAMKRKFSIFNFQFSIICALMLAINISADAQLGGALNRARQAVQGAAGNNAGTNNTTEKAEPSTNAAPSSLANATPAIAKNAVADTREIRKSYTGETSTPPQPWEIATENSLEFGEGLLRGRDKIVKGSVTATFANGVLTIKGTGKMRIFGDGKFARPWGAIRNEITSIVIEDDVYNIGEGAFTGCENLTSVKLGNTLIEIGGGAFGSCTSLKEITIPKSVETVGRNNNYNTRTFENCTSLTAIKVEAGNENFVSDSGILYSKRGKTRVLMCYPAGKEGASFKIPDDVDQLQEGAFSFSKLSEVTVPTGGGINAMGVPAYTFEKCANLQSLTLLDTNNVALPSLSYETAFAGADLKKLKIFVPAALLEKYTTDNYQNWYFFKENIYAITK